MMQMGFCLLMSFLKAERKKKIFPFQAVYSGDGNRCIKSSVFQASTLQRKFKNPWRDKSILINTLPHFHVDALVLYYSTYSHTLSFFFFFPF